MSLVNISGVNIVPGIMARLSTPAIATTNFTMSETADHCGAIIIIPRTGTLTKIGVRVATMTTSDTLKVSLEGVDATNGRPDGTPIGGGTAYGTQSGLTANTTYWIPINSGSGVSVTAGQKVAVTIRWNSTAGNIAIAYGVVNAIPNIGFPYVYSYDNTGTVWAFNNYTPNFGVEYNDGSIEPIVLSFPAISVSAVSWNNSTTPGPNRRGLRFSTPYKTVISGVLVDVDQDGDCNIILYDSDGVTELENISVDANIRYSETSASTQYVPFSTPRTLNVNTFYRLIILPASATNVAITNIVVTDDNANAAMNSLDGGVNFHYTTCNGTPSNEASWTQTLTTRPPIALVVSQLDNGAGGGGSSGPWGMIR